MPDHGGPGDRDWSAIGVLHDEEEAHKAQQQEPQPWYVRPLTEEEKAQNVRSAGCWAFILFFALPSLTLLIYLIVKTAEFAR